MEAGRRIHVPRDILVAVEAQGVLLGLGKGDVAIPAAGLKLCVSRDHGSGHHELLDFQGANWRRDSKRNNDE